MNINFSHKQNNLSIIERFSMYIDIQYFSNNSNPNFISQSNPILAKLISLLLENQPHKKEDYWSRLFLQGLLLNNTLPYSLFKLKVLSLNFNFFIIYLELCQQLLICYLQLVCFYSAKKVSVRFIHHQNLKFYYSIEDCFLIACEASINPGKLLKSFNFNLHFPVYGYAKNAIIRVITNRIAKDLKSKSIKFSDWALLVYSGCKELESSLHNYGISADKLILYRLVWQGYKDILQSAKITGNKKISLTDSETKLILNYCQQQIARLDIKTIKLDSKKINDILLVCLKAIKQNQLPLIVSSDEVKGDSGRTIIDQVSSDIDSYQELVEGEEKKEINNLKNIINHELNSLDKLGKACLLLWLGLGLNQKEFLILLDCNKQYQVTRKFQSYQKNILKKIINFYKEQDEKVDKNQLSKEKINQLCMEQINYVKEYLEKYSKEFFSKYLQDLIIEEITLVEREILLDSVTGKLSNREQKIKIQTKMNRLFQAIIEDKLEISLQQFSSITQVVDNFINCWLKNNQAILY